MSSYSRSSRLPAARATIRASRDEHSSAQLVLVVGTATPAEARQLLVEGVPGLVLEKHAEATITLAARTTLVGQICYPAELMPTHLKTALSTREKQILGMVVMGFSNAEIAAKLFVSQSTVKSHLSSAFATMGVRSRKEAVAVILDPDAGFGTGILAITGAGENEVASEVDACQGVGKVRPSWRRGSLHRSTCCPRVHRCPTTWSTASSSTRPSS